MGTDGHDGLSPPARGYWLFCAASRPVLLMAIMLACHSADHPPEGGTQKGELARPAAKNSGCGQRPAGRRPWRLAQGRDACKLLSQPTPAAIHRPASRRTTRCDHPGSQAQTEPGSASTAQP